MVLQSSIDRDVTLISRLGAIPTILEVVALTTGMRFTAVARVTDTQWVACAVHDQIDFGLEAGGELVLESTICNEIRQHHEPVMFGHASADPHFATHPTPKLYGLESYVSVPIVLSDGSFFGTLCAIDPAPAKLDDPKILKILQAFTRLIAAQFEAEARRDSAEAELLDAQATARLRDQFVAVLAHDLRNPVHSINLGADMLVRGLPEGRERRLAEHVHRSSERMAELISNIMDFARGKLGGGLAVTLEPGVELAADLEHVISEIQIAYPDRRIEASISLPFPTPCDGKRIAQMLGNLVSNAVVHGSTTAPIKVRITGTRTLFELSVENAGEPIDPDKLGRLFQPFTRGTDTSPQPGLGLGLYIAAEIARAHGGALTASSDSASTRFVFRLPLDTTCGSTSPDTPGVLPGLAENLPG